MYSVKATICKIISCCLLALMAAVAVHGADAHPPANNRQLKTKIMPEYPELARQFQIKGSVRLELLVKPDGHVQKINVLGGNPVLAQAAILAVRKWRYEPANAESNIVVKLDFDPGSK